MRFPVYSKVNRFRIVRDGAEVVGIDLIFRKAVFVH